MSKWVLSFTFTPRKRIDEAPLINSKNSYRFKVQRQTCTSSSAPDTNMGRSSLGTICTFAPVNLFISNNDPSLPSKHPISLDGTSNLVVTMFSLSGTRSTMRVWMCNKASCAGKSSSSGP